MSKSPPSAEKFEHISYTIYNIEVLSTYMYAKQSL